MTKTNILRFPVKRAQRRPGWPPEPPTPLRMPVPVPWRFTLAIGRVA